MTNYELAEAIAVANWAVYQSSGDTRATWFAHLRNLLSIQAARAEEAE